MTTINKLIALLMTLTFVFNPANDFEEKLINFVYVHETRKVR